MDTLTILKNLREDIAYIIMSDFNASDDKRIFQTATKITKKIDEYIKAEENK